MEHLVIVVIASKIKRDRLGNPRKSSRALILHDFVIGSLDRRRKKWWRNLCLFGFDISTRLGAGNTSFLMASTLPVKSHSVIGTVWIQTRRSIACMPSQLLVRGDARERKKLPPTNYWPSKLRAEWFVNVFSTIFHLALGTCCRLKTFAVASRNMCWIRKLDHELIRP